MGELGQLLRQAREAKGLSLAQAEAETKIRSAFLQALEEENYEHLPPKTYIKGFLRNYARYLGLDTDQVLALYSEPEAAQAKTSAPVLLNEPLQPLQLRRFWPIWAALLVIILAVAGWLIYTRYYGGRLPFPRATATPTVTVTPVPPSPTLTLTATPSPTPTATSTPTPVAGLNLGIEIIGQRSWIRVEVDGQEVFVGTLEPGTTNAWTARERIVLRCGNAGAVRVTLNGQILGFLGQSGQVLEQEWTALGVPTRTRPAPTPTRAT